MRDEAFTDEESARGESAAATRSDGQAAAKRVGICFNDGEMFWWRSDGFEPCPMCSTDDEDYAANHRFYIAEEDVVARFD